MLARLAEEFPGELRADFQQYYGLNIDDMGVLYTHSHAAELAAYLPKGCRTRAAVHPCDEWSEELYILSSIEYSLRVLAWQNTDAAKKGLGKPKPLRTPAQTAEIERRIEDTDIEHVSKMLGIPREGGE